MRKSDAFYRRRELLKTFEFPNQSEVLARHGERLTKVLNEYVSPHLKSDLGLEPPLKGAGEDLWISPSDMLIPHVRLKPPLTTKHIRALTHEGILESGLFIQQQLQDELKARVNIEMKLLREKLGFMCKRKIAQAREAEKVNSAAILEAEMTRLESEYNTKIQEELEALKTQMTVECEAKLCDERIKIKEEMEGIYTVKLQEFADEIIAEFNEQLKMEKQKFADELTTILLTEEEKLQAALEAAESEKTEVIRLLEHDLECRNMANIMYILTAERNRAEEEKSIIHDEYKTKIDEMTTKVIDLHNTILHLENVCEYQQTAIEDWERQMLRICQEFQKFITFALKACPTQAEFLIDSQKFIYDHIKQSIKCKTPLNRLNSMSPPALMLPTMKENEEIDNTMRCPPTEPEPDLLEPSSRRTLDSDEDLARFIYNRHVYVREDFRNKNLQKAFSPDPEIWNKESLEMDFQQQMYKADNRVKYPISSTVKFSFQPGESSTKIKKQPSKVPMTPKRSVLVPPSRSIFEKRKIQLVSTVPVPSKEILQKNIQNKPKLLLSRNSLITNWERLLKNNKQKPKESYSDLSIDIKSMQSSKIACTKDSLEVYKKRTKKRSSNSKNYDGSLSKDASSEKLIQLTRQRSNSSNRISDEQSAKFDISPGIQRMQDDVNGADDKQEISDTTTDELMSFSDMDSHQNKKFNTIDSINFADDSKISKESNKFSVVGDATIQIDAPSGRYVYDRIKAVQEICHINKKLIEKSIKYYREYLKEYKNS